MEQEYLRKCKAKTCSDGSVAFSKGVLLRLCYWNNHWKSRRGLIYVLHRQFCCNGSITKLEITWRRELPLSWAAIGTVLLSKVGIEIIDIFMDFSGKILIEGVLHPLLI